MIAKLGEKEDLYQAASRIGEFILSAPKMDCITLRPGVAMLGVDKPERYRAQLLNLIAEHIAASKAGLGSARDIEVGGLEKPVQLIQKNSRDVTLFLTYTLKIRLSHPALGTVFTLPPAPPAPAPPPPLHPRGRTIAAPCRRKAQGC